MYDTIIIGAGLGGLIAGAKLTADGQRVLVLEKHSIPGGYATTFERRNVDHEVSLDEIDGLDEADPKRDIFEELGVFDAVEFEPVGAYRLAYGSNDLVLPHDDERAADRIADEYPHEEEGIREFFETVMEIRSDIAMFSKTITAPGSSSSISPGPTLAKYWETSLGEFLDAVVDDEDVKFVLSFNYGYYGGDPYDISLSYYAAGQGSYFAGGGHYIKGGSQALSDYLASVVTDNGGEVRTGRFVDEILVEGGAATGVRHYEVQKTAMTDDTAVVQPKSGAEEENASAENVVVNAPIPNVADGMLSEPYGGQLRDEITDFEHGPSLTVLYVTFDPSASEFNDSYSTFITDGRFEQADDLGDLAELSNTGAYSRRTLAFVDYSQVDANLAPAGKSVGSITTLDSASNWTGLSDEAYRRTKRQVRDVLLDRLDDFVPGSRDAVEHAELATPLTMERYTLNPGGAVYGFSQKPSQAMFDRRIEAPLPNVEFASAWTFPGGGFSGVILSGYGAATKILGQ